MALRISFGQFFPANSVLHRLDPRVKILCSLALMLAVFVILTPAQLALGWLAMLALVALSKVPAAKLFASIRPVILMLLALSVFNICMLQSGPELFALGPLRITTNGAWASALYSLRLVLAIIAGTLVLLTTTPTQLTDAFDALLSPLSRIGLPGHEIAMVFSLMLRFIPLFADETQAILDAQTSRGGALAEGSLLRRLHAVVPILVALLASSLRHADGLSRALDARCYEGGASRTHWHPLKLRAHDGFAAIITLIYLLFLLALPVFVS